jgi:DNA-binding NarL/FixJ family response regulator
MNTTNNNGTSDSQAAARPIRVLLADDHGVMLWGLRQLIASAAPSMVVAGVATACNELMAHPALTQTDVVLLDLGLRDANALDCLPTLVNEAGLKVVVLTGELNPAKHRDAVLRGARGIVLKSDPTENILRAIERVHAGEVWLDGAMMSTLLGGITGAAPKRSSLSEEIARRHHSLTAKEREVVQAMVQHRGAKSLIVAEALHMSEHTLRNHLTVIYSKLGVQGKLNLYAYAIEQGLAKPPAAPMRPTGLPSAWGSLSSFTGTPA